MARKIFGQSELSLMPPVGIPFEKLLPADEMPTAEKNGSAL
jgi:hypothetical protein